MRLRPLVTEAECAERWIVRLRDLKLTHREAEVLLWVSRGKTNHEIGMIIGAKCDTIRTHVGSILRKLSVENRTAAAVSALEVIGPNDSITRVENEPFKDAA